MTDSELRERLVKAGLWASSWESNPWSTQHTFELVLMRLSFKCSFMRRARKKLCLAALEAVEGEK